MYQPREAHWSVALRILAYLKSCPEKGLAYKKHEHVHISVYSESGYAGDRGYRKPITVYCTFIEGNLVIWRSKKLDVVSRSSAEGEYRAMTHTACETGWLKNLLIELDFRQSGSTRMHYNNQSDIYIAQNHVFDERTKHIEANCHFVRDDWTKVITFQFTTSSKQLADLLTKTVSLQVFSNLCNKLDMLDIYAPS